MLDATLATGFAIDAPQTSEIYIAEQMLGQFNAFVRATYQHDSA
jgi:hypothetical protein